MVFSILEINTDKGKEEYLNLILMLKIKDPYAQLGYLEVFSGGLENLVCFFYSNKESNNWVMMLVHLNPITIGKEPTLFYDVITSYGYSGPILSANILEFELLEFWQNVDSWCFLNNVVSAFIRFNLTNNHLSYSGEVFPTMLNIKGAIINEDLQWKSFDRKVRKNVNKAKRENLCSEIYFLDIIDEKIAEFHDIYIHTMKRTNANETFLYSFNQFKKFLNNNRGYAAICTIYFEDTAVSSELLLISEDSVYSFLGGTNDSFFYKRPNDFLKVAALNWARTQGKKYYVLGGGYGLEDGIFKYKKCFFPNDVVTYYTGRRILNKVNYDQLVTKASKLRVAKGLLELDVEDKTFFPLYNKVN